MGPNGNLYLAHVGKGMYALQLQRWFKILGQQNFKVRAVSMQIKLVKPIILLCNTRTIFYVD